MLQQNQIQLYDVIIIGAGAAGLMCAAEAGKRGRSVLILDHSKKPAEKIRISGGGRCNFTNINAKPENFLSQNPKFCISALKKYTADDFVKLVMQHNISFHEKTLGQLFCDGSSQQIIDMLLMECFKGDVKIQLESIVNNILKTENGFDVTANNVHFSCASLVVATGGPSIPKIGGSGFGYKIAEKFGLKIIAPRAALVPLILDNNTLDHFKALSGISLNVIAKYERVIFEEGMLFTHRGLSGPVILQISSYWREGNAININLVPKFDIFQELVSRKLTTPKQDISSALTDILPKRLIQTICNFININGQLANLPNAKLKEFAEFINNWWLIPSGTEGYKTAEVTQGGVDTNELFSNSFESKKVPGLYFIGEVIDVTGHLGGYNFQWAWSSGYVAGQVV